MIINTGQRTDIPAFYSDWFYRRIKEKYVYVRNPYYPKRVIKYSLDPHVVDCLCFCTKNPLPMLERLDELKDYKQFWFVTITPYGKDIEPHVPPVQKVVRGFQQLSQKVGSYAVGWRYDPIFINQRYTIDYHLKAFEKIASSLYTYTHQCVVSFIDLYEKTKRNFPHVQEVTKHDQQIFIQKMVEIAQKYDMTLYTCLESQELKKYGVNTDGCMNQKVIEKAIGEELLLPKKQVRKGCYCLIGNDIGAYNTCLHGCLYCYANENKDIVLQSSHQHDPHSPLLVGYLHKDDELVEAKQSSSKNPQLSFDL